MNADPKTDTSQVRRRRGAEMRDGAVAVIRTKHDDDERTLIYCWFVATRRWLFVGIPRMDASKAPPLDPSQMSEENRAVLAASRGKNDLGDDHYKRVAAIYVEAVRAGEPPTKAVAEALVISKSAAAKQVSRTRERGFLPKTTRGRVGGPSDPSTRMANDAFFNWLASDEVVTVTITWKQMQR